MRYRTRPIRTPLQTHLHVVCRGTRPAARKKTRRAKRELRPRCRALAARPRAATPLSRRPSAFGTRVTIVLMLAVYRTRVPSRGPGKSIERSWRPRAKSIVAKDESHDALGWRHGVGLLEKYSRPCGLLIFRRRHRGRSSRREIAFGTPVTIVLASRAIEGVPSRDSDMSLRDEIQIHKEIAKAAT